MIGASPFASIFGAVLPGDSESLKGVVRQAIRSGFAPVLIKPGTKEPMCTLTAAGATRADTEAQRQALAADPDRRIDGIRHACGLDHALTDPAKVTGIVDRAIARYGPALNLALVLGPSRLVTVDVDTPAELAAFRAACQQNGQHPPGLTIESPGAQDRRTGQWIHHGGGHVYYRLPDGAEMPPSPHKAQHPGGFAVMWGRAYGLVPPSVRAEGPYRLTGDAGPCPDWLGHWILAQGAARAGQLAERLARPAGDYGGDITAVNAATPWASLLQPDGWARHGTDSCGCSTWTAPGAHASPKSATAHEPDCGQAITDDGLLKLWTDNPPAGLPPAGAVSKLQYVAAAHFGGDVRAAMAAAGISAGGASAAGDWHPLAAGVAQADASSWDPVDLAPYLDGKYAPPPPSLLLRSDGQPLLYPGLTHSIYGEPESGKSWLALLACAQAIRAGLDALYLDMESDPGAMADRLRILGCTREQILAHFVYVSPDGPLSDSDPRWETLFRRRFAVVVCDALAGGMGLFGLKPKDDADVTAFYRRVLARIATQTGAAVLAVDHVIKDRDSRGQWSTGSERKIGALSGAAFSLRKRSPFGKGQRGESQIWIAKDRAGGLRGVAGPPDRDHMQQIGVFTLDAEGGVGGVTAGIRPQDPPDETSPESDAIERITGYLADHPGASQHKISANAGGNAETTRAVLKLLINARPPVVRTEPGRQLGSFRYYLTPAPEHEGSVTVSDRV